MTYKIKATFAEGVTQEQLAQITQSMGITRENPPAGSIKHQEFVEDGRIVYIDEWTSEAAFNVFLKQLATPAHSEVGVPLPEIEEI